MSAQQSARCPLRCLSRRSSRVTWTTVTHHIMASVTDYFNDSSQCRMLPPAWSQALVVVTTSHRCYSNCTGCQFVSGLCSRLRGSCNSRSLLRCTLLMTVVFCLTLVIARCSPIQTTCRSCSCRKHTINLEIGVYRQPVLDCGTIFHLDYSGLDSPSIQLRSFNKQ